MHLYLGYKKTSLVDIFAIRQVDKKRLLSRKWYLNEGYIEKLNDGLLKLFDIKK